MTATENQTKKEPATKEKLHSVMEAASALTALCDEESAKGEGAPSTPKVAPEESADTAAEEAATPKDDGSKRFLPDHKKPDAALTFPEKLMNLMEFADQQNKEECCVAWLADGKSFIIRNPDEFTRQLVPKYFKATKFSSFTRKLYRWGFRQVNRGIGPDDPIIFGNEHFQRDNAEFMSKMRSITAAGTRKQDDTHGMFSMKRSMEDSMDDGHHKRMLLDHLMNQQKASMMSQNPSLYGAMNTNGSMSLSNALRPSMAMGQMNQGTNHSMTGMNGNNNNNNNNRNNMQNMQPYDMMANQSQMHGNGMNNNYNMPQGNNNGNGNGNTQYPNASSTTEIVNAAIAALRYA